MGKHFIFFVLFIAAQSLLWCNPSDYKPIAKFSELVFDNNNNWTMEIYFPIYGGPDSIVFNISGKTAGYKATYTSASRVYVITSDSLTNPLTINRDGDKIVIYSFLGNVQKDSIMFGNYPGATVGAPDSGYSILRYYTLLPSNNYLTIDCLTKHPSLGVVNDTVGLSGTLKGHIYDKDNKLVKSYYFPDGTNYIFLEGLLTINSDGSYSTPIFNTIYKPGFIYVQFTDFEGASDTLKIEPFELGTIRPDTIVYRDIHFVNTCSYCSLVDAVKKDEQIKNNELTLINYPNPFNLSTNFFVKIPDSMKGSQKSVGIYNVRGQLIRTIPLTGSSTIQWDSKDMKGKVMSSGIYYYRLIIDGRIIKNGSMILLK